MSAEKLIYITHQRIVSEKTPSYFIMKTCEGFAANGLDTELWLPWRYNPAFRREDPFKYHNIRYKFAIKRIPALDLFPILPGKLPFYILLASFNLSIFFYVIFRGFGSFGWNSDRSGRVIFYLHDIRDALALVLFKNSIFVEVHDYYQSGFAAINRWIMPRIAGFISTNKIKMERLNQEFGISYERMLHQPNVVDIEMFAQDMSQEEARAKLGLPPDKKIILYTGHLYDWKGADTLLEAAQFLAGDTEVYFVGGTEADIKKFSVKCQMPAPHRPAVSGTDAGLNAKCIVVGRRPHQEIPLWQKAADVLVLPNSGKFQESKYETSPTKLFEYMASGRPIVASDLPSIREVVDDSMVWFFEPDNPESLAKVIKEVLACSDHSDVNSDCLDRVSVARKEAEKYTWEKRARRILDFVTARKK